jgi:cobalt-zinc-cadmium efflux system membrane fusion protein
MDALNVGVSIAARSRRFPEEEFRMQCSIVLYDARRNPACPIGGIMTPHRHILKYLVPSLLGLAALGLSSRGLFASHASAAADPDAAAPVPALRHDGARLVVPDASPLRRTLAVATLADETVAAPFTLPAVVEADPARLVKVLTPVTGRIVSIARRLGDEVRVGDVLFTIDSVDLAQAHADAAKAHAALALAQRNLARQRELDASEIAARRDLEQAQGDYEQAASEAARADARLAQLGAGKTAAGGRVLAVRAPIAGRVVDLAAAAGGYWNDATAPLMTVADLSRVFVTANAQEKDLGRVYAGQSASVVFDAYPEPLEAKVGVVGALLDPDTRTVKVRIPCDNRDGRLKPGMFAEATFRGRPHQGVLVPMTAVVQSGFDTRTFVEVAPWQFEPRIVTLGPQIGERVEVLAGLKPGERVVTKDGVLLND